jgi:DNA-nicking Smr family endonuclease
VEVERPTVAEDPNKLTLGHVPDVKPYDTLAWKQDGVQDRVFRKLKQGAYEVQAELDLHRKTVREARVAVYDFLKLGLAKGWRTVLIAHGRGEKSPTPARIKSYVAAWLRDSPDVIAFHSAPPKRGGTGAVYALLKKSAAHREENRERHGQKGDFD